MKGIRPMLFIVLLLGMVVLILSLSPFKKELGISFSPLFQMLGEPVKSVNTAVARVLPVEDIDEVEFGNELTRYFVSSNESYPNEALYLNELVKRLSIYSKRRVRYEVFIQKESFPNAYALPGGGIVVTTPLLDILRSESELVSILAHEMGHIEQSHCLNSVKYELAAKKIGLDGLGGIADFANALLIRHAYSKAQENEADVYAFDLLIQTEYDPDGLYLAFQRMHDADERAQQTSTIVTDYFDSHPQIQHRLDKFRAKSEKWKRAHSKTKRYVGTQNLAERKSFFDSQYSGEWR